MFPFRHDFFLQTADKFQHHADNRPETNHNNLPCPCANQRQGSDRFPQPVYRDFGCPNELQENMFRQMICQLQ